MIIARIHGGLGNQMFQYATAKAIAKKNGDIFKLDCSFFKKQHLRKYELNLFNIEENIASSEEIKKLAGDEDIIFKIKRKLRLPTKRPNSYFQEKQITRFDKSVFQYSGSIYLDGYWQCEEYFNDIREEILKDFTPKESLSQVVCQYLKDILEFNSVSIHVRRGDYIQDSHTKSVHGVCDIKYYEQSVKKIESMVESPMFFIFSDDIEWCKENFNFIDTKIFVDETKSAIDDLILMKNCKHNVIANSTFSWWGAWLNENEKQIAISPNIWFKDKRLKDLTIINNRWIKI